MLEDVGSCWKMLGASAPELCSAKKEMSPNAERFALSWQDIMPWGQPPARGGRHLLWMMAGAPGRYGKTLKDWENENRWRGRTNGSRWELPLRLGRSVLGWRSGPQAGESTLHKECRERKQKLDSILDPSLRILKQPEMARKRCWRARIWTGLWQSELRQHHLGDQRLQALNFDAVSCYICYSFSREWWEWLGITKECQVPAGAAAVVFAAEGKSQPPPVWAVPGQMIWSHNVTCFTVASQAKFKIFKSSLVSRLLWNPENLQALCSCILRDVRIRGANLLRAVSSLGDADQRYRWYRCSRFLILVEIRMFSFWSRKTSN